MVYQTNTQRITDRLNLKVFHIYIYIHLYTYIYKHIYTQNDSLLGLKILTPQLTTVIQLAKLNIHKHTRAVRPSNADLNVLTVNIARVLERKTPGR